MRAAGRASAGRPHRRQRRGRRASPGRPRRGDVRAHRRLGKCRIGVELRTVRRHSQPGVPAGRRYHPVRSSPCRPCGAAGVPVPGPRSTRQHLLSVRAALLPYVAPYVTAKWGLLGFSEVLRQELRDAPGVAVCTILPGAVDTPICRHAANYIGRQIRPLPPVTSPERVVAAVVRAVDRPEREIIVGRAHLGAWAHWLGAWAHWLVPGLYDRLVGPIVNEGAPPRHPGPRPRWHRVRSRPCEQRRDAVAAVALRSRMRSARRRLRRRWSSARDSCRTQRSRGPSERHSEKCCDA